MKIRPALAEGKWYEKLTAISATRAEPFPRLEQGREYRGAVRAADQDHAIALADHRRARRIAARLRLRLFASSLPIFDHRTGVPVAVQWAIHGVSVVFLFFCYLLPPALYNILTNRDSTVYCRVRADTSCERAARKRAVWVWVFLIRINAPPSALAYITTKLKAAGQGDAMSVRIALKLFLLSIVVFGVAFALRRMFLWDVMPVSWDQEPQSLWALGTAFLLRSIENLAAVVGVISLAVAAVLWLSGKRPIQPPKLRDSKQ